MDPLDITKETTAKQDSKCGFGQSGDVYCPRHLGDKTSIYYQVIQLYKDAFATGLKCHKHSDGFYAGVDCKDLRDKLGDNHVKMIYQFTYLLGLNENIVPILNSPWV